MSDGSNWRLRSWSPPGKRHHSESDVADGIDETVVPHHSREVEDGNGPRPRERASQHGATDRHILADRRDAHGREGFAAALVWRHAGWSARRECADLQLGTRSGRRSEEHTSELQSRENLVCRLLLEKKKREARARADWRQGRYPVVNRCVEER